MMNSFNLAANVAVIGASGGIGKAVVQPEKTMQSLSGNTMSELFNVNTIGPALLAKHFLPVMRKSGKSVFAVLSARVGSISDNRLGGWVSYRASKAALNMVIKTLSIEQARRCPESIVVSLHPGTVDTALSKPFSSSVAATSLFTPEHSAACLLAVVDDLDTPDSGGFFAWDGEAIEY